MSVPITARVPGVVRAGAVPGARPRVELVRQPGHEPGDQDRTERPHVEDRDGARGEGRQQILCEPENRRREQGASRGLQPRAMGAQRQGDDRGTLERPGDGDRGPVELEGQPRGEERARERQQVERGLRVAPAHRCRQHPIPRRHPEGHAAEAFQEELLDDQREAGPQPQPVQVQQHQLGGRQPILVCRGLAQLRHEVQRVDGAERHERRAVPPCRTQGDPAQRGQRHEHPRGQANRHPLQVAGDDDADDGCGDQVDEEPDRCAATGCRSTPRDR